MHITQNT